MGGGQDSALNPGPRSLKTRQRNAQRSARYGDQPLHSLFKWISHDDGNMNVLCVFCHQPVILLCDNQRTSISHWRLHLYGERV